jgi:gamma-glutamyltranspeptidase/glutathione hydrolase
MRIVIGVAGALAMALLPAAPAPAEPAFPVPRCAPPIASLAQAQMPPVRPVGAGAERAGLSPMQPSAAAPAQPAPVQPAVAARALPEPAGPQPAQLQLAGPEWPRPATLRVARAQQVPSQPAPPPAAASAEPQPVLAVHHMAATANPLASAAAQSVLRDGGSAVDAAIAAQMVLGVVEPQSSGLGGGALMLAWRAQGRALMSFEGLASAPAAVKTQWTLARDDSRIPAEVIDHSGRVIGVPGTLRMLALAHRRLGKLAWARLFRDAIALAEDGFPLAPYLHTVLLRHPDLAHVEGFGALYFGADGQPLPVGTVLRNPTLAATMRLVAARGPDAFYQGAVAQDIVAAANRGAYGGQMILHDLFAYQAHERPPVCEDVFARRMCSAGPPGAGGIAVLQQLAILDRLGIAHQAPGSVAAVHLFLEAGRLTEADRHAWIGDPDQVEVPVAGLLDPGYLTRRAALISLEGAMASAGPGDPLPGQKAPPAGPMASVPGTTHIAVVDDAGNVVSFTTTINLDFGVWRMVDGFVLNDGLTNFAAHAVVDGQRVANAIAPDKRPISTMAPSIVFGADGRPALIVGAGGGARIIDATAETVLGVLAWGEDVRTAIDAPRYGAQTGHEELERGTAAAGLAAGLAALGDHPEPAVMNAGVQAIHRVDRDGARWEGWGDPHRDGVALGD